MKNRRFLAGSGGPWKSDGADGISTDKEVHAVVIPRHETAEALDTIPLAEGEIATTPDGQVRLGNAANTLGGDRILDPVEYQKRVGMSFERDDNYMYLLDNSLMGMDMGIFMVACGNGVVVRIKKEGSGPYTYTTCVSRDGISFDELAGPTSVTGSGGVYYVGGLFIKVSSGGWATSVDGRNWKEHLVPGIRLRNLCFFKNAIYAYDSGNQRIVKSTTGESFETAIDLTSYGNLFPDMLGVGKYLYCIGNYLLLITASYERDRHILCSGDGETLTEIDAGFSELDFRPINIVYGNGVYLFMESGAIITTSDFVTFTPIDTSIIPWGAQCVFYNGLFFAAKYSSETHSCIVLVSEDGLNRRVVQSFTDIDAYYSPLRLGNALFLYENGGYIYRSGNIFPPENDYLPKEYEINYGDKKVAGDVQTLPAGAGLILTSPDGNTTKRVYLTNAGALDVEDVT